MTKKALAELAALRAENEDLKREVERLTALLIHKNKIINGLDDTVQYIKAENEALKKIK